LDSSPWQSDWQEATPEEQVDEDDFQDFEDKIPTRSTITLVREEELEGVLCL
jgi:hypothetical protein